MPFWAFPEMMLRARAFVPPIVLKWLFTSTPETVLGKTVVPLASKPMMLPCTAQPFAFGFELRATPLPLPELTLPANGTKPPITLLPTGPAYRMPVRLPSAVAPVASGPICWIGAAQLDHQNRAVAHR